MKVWRTNASLTERIMVQFADGRSAISGNAAKVPIFFDQNGPSIKRFCVALVATMTDRNNQKAQ